MHGATDCSVRIGDQGVQMKLAAMTLVGLMMFGQAGVPPVKVQEPVTREVMRCPEGYALWHRLQTGVKSLPGDNPFLLELIYQWFPYDGTSITWGDSTPTCFIGDPNKKGPK